LEWWANTRPPGIRILANSVKASAEDLGDFVAGQPPQAEFAAAFEEFVDGKVALGVAFTYCYSYIQALLNALAPQLDRD
jgi:hypothetical protein